MMAVSRASLRGILKSPSAIIFTLAFPLIFIIVFGFIGQGIFHVSIGVSPGSDIDNSIYRYLKNDSAVVTVVHNSDSLALIELLRKGELDGLLSINRSAKGNLEMSLTTTDAKAQTRTLVSSLLNNAILELYKSDQDFHQLNVPVNPRIRETVITNREYKSIDFILPGQLGFALLSSGVFGVAFVFLNMRQTMILKRYFATPIKRSYIVLGEATARMVFALTGALIIIIIGRYAFGFTLVNGMVTVLNMMLLSFLGVVVFMGFGFLVSGLARNESSVPPLANIVTLPQFLLSGTFFSISVFPWWLQPISKALPLTYLNDALRKVAFDGVPLYHLGTEIAVLCVWGVVVYALAVKFFRWE